MSRKVKNAGILFAIIVAFFAHSLAHAENNDCSSAYASFQGRVVKSNYSVGSPRGNQMTFSYELEFDLRETPKLLNYYKPIGMDEQKWLALSLEERVAQVKKLDEDTKFKGNLLEKTSAAPAFLADHAIRESSGRVELAANAVLSDLAATSRDLDWVWKNIGAGSAQGHVAFDRAEVNGAQHFIKLNADEKQAEALERGYQRYLQDGTIPAKNLAHHSLGPLDKSGADWLEKELRKNLPDVRSQVNKSDKFTYSISYRPDLYGEEKIGFEIRNCHKSLDCLKQSLLDVAEAAESNFNSYKGLGTSTSVLDPKWLRGMPDGVKRVFSKVGGLLERRWGPALSGPQPQSRFLLPFTNWDQHPYVGALPLAEQHKFLQLAGLKAREFEARVIDLDIRGPRDGKLIDELQIAVAKWAHESGLSSVMAKGKAAFLEQNGLTPLKSTAAELSSEGVMRMKRAFAPYLNMESRVIVDRLRKLLVQQGDRFSAVEMEDLLRSASDVERAQFSKNLLADERFATYLSNAWRLGHRELFQGIAFSEGGGRVLRSVFAQTGTERQYLLDLLSETGLRTSTAKPLGGAVRKVLAEAETGELSKVLHVAEAVNIKHEEFGYLLSSPSFFESSYAKNPLSLDHLRNLMTGKEAPASSADWLAAEFRKQGLSKQDKSMLIEALAASAEDPTVLGDGYVKVKLAGKEYIFSGSNEKSASLSLASEMSPQILAKISAAAASQQRGKFFLGPFDLKKIESDTSGVYITSKTLGSINHQRLIVGGQIFSMSGSEGVYAKPIKNSGIEKNRVIKLKVTAEQAKVLEEKVKARMNKRVKWTVRDPKPGEHNCTTWISCDLEEAGIAKFPNDQVRGDAIAQSDYLIAQAAQDSVVEKVFVNNEGYNQIKRQYKRLVFLAYWVPRAAMGLGAVGGVALPFAIYQDIKREKEEFIEKNRAFFQQLGVDFASRMDSTGSAALDHSRKYFYDRVRFAINEKRCSVDDIKEMLKDSRVSAKQLNLLYQEIDKANK
jgi:hypothetical protein